MTSLVSDVMVGELVKTLITRTASRRRLPNQTKIKQAAECFRAVTGGEGGVMGLTALKAAARMAGVSSEAVGGDEVLEQVLRNNARAKEGEVNTKILKYSTDSNK